MKKIIMVITIALTLVCSYSNTKLNTIISTDLNTATYTGSSEITKKLICCDANQDAVIILLLRENITNAVCNYFGEYTQMALYDGKVTTIAQIDNSFSFEVTITIPTFHGVHNPPYELEIMTFTIAPGDIILNNYTHKDTNYLM